MHRKGRATLRAIRELSDIIDITCEDTLAERLLDI